MPIVIRPIQNRHDLRLFLTFPWRVFRGDRMWVPPILSEMEKRLDPQRGAWFTHGDAECFAAWDGRQFVGTICCAEDRARNAYIQGHEAIFGFNHYLPDYRIAMALWDHAASWACARGLDTLYGPFDLDYEDAYGILVEGYDRPPALMCGHTPPYYREFVERYGFVPARDQNIALEASLEMFDNPNGPIAKLKRVAEIVRRRGRVTVRPGKLDDWENEIDRIISLLNRALAHLQGFSPWQHEGLAALAHEVRDLIDPDLVLFGEADGQVVGVVVGLPNLNEVLIHANGLRYPWDKLRAWWAWRHRPECLSLKSILVDPAHWGRGVEALMLYELGRRAVDKGYHWIDMSITGLENPMTPRLATRQGARIYKRWQVYKKTLEKLALGNG